MIDLSTCVPGQQVKYLCGEYGEYIGPTDGDFPQFRTKKDSGMTFRHTQSGSVPTGGYSYPYDIVKIFPLEAPEEQPMIDLSTCVPGQKVRFQNGKFGFVSTSPSRARSGNSEMWSVNTGGLNWLWYTLDGIQGKDLPDPEWQIVEILPVEIPEEKPPIDLSTCAYGQKVEYRDGTTGTVRGRNCGGSSRYRTKPDHLSDMQYHTKEGKSNNLSQYDVVKIFPLEPLAEQPMIDLSTCVRGQKVRFANGKIGEVGNSFTSIGSFKVRTVQSDDHGWCWYTLDGKDTDPRDPEWKIVEILPIEIPEEKPMEKPQEMDYKKSYIEIANIISVAFPECEVTTVDMARLLVNENRTLRLALGLPTYEEVEDLTYTEVYG